MHDQKLSIFNLFLKPTLTQMSKWNLCQDCLLVALHLCFYSSDCSLDLCRILLMNKIWKCARIHVHVLQGHLYENDETLTHLHVCIRKLNKNSATTHLTCLSFVRSQVMIVTQSSVISSQPNFVTTPLMRNAHGNYQMWLLLKILHSLRWY